MNSALMFGLESSFCELYHSSYFAQSRDNGFCGELIHFTTSHNSSSLSTSKYDIDQVLSAYRGYGFFLTGDRISNGSLSVIGSS